MPNEDRLKKTVKIELSVKEIKHIENSLRGWADTLTERYKLEKKPFNAQKKKIKSAIDELYTLASFFNKAY